MNEENWIVPLGSILVVVLTVVTFVYWETNKIPGVAEITSNNINDLNAPAQVAKVVMNNNAANQKKPNNNVQGAVNYPRSIVITGRKMFDGRVEAIHKEPLDHDTIHVMLRSDTGKMREVSLAPAWYLSFIGCTISRGALVQSGSGFSFDRQTKNPSIIFAQKMKINNTTCRFRNSSGFAYWSNHLR